FVWRNSKGGASYAMGSTTIDTGATAPDGVSLHRRSDATFPGTSPVQVATAQGLNLVPLRGRYMAWIRARQDGGTAGQITMFLQYGYTKASWRTIGTTSPSVTALIGTGGAGNTTEWPIHYMGTIDFPVDGRAPIDTDGKLQTGTNGVITLWAARSAGA